MRAERHVRERGGVRRLLSCMGDSHMASDTYPNLGFDPAPGDVQSVRDLVSAVGRVTGKSDTAQTDLSKIGTSDGLWVGKSADAFTETFSPVPPYLKKAAGSLSTAHRALSTWQTQLENFQIRARKLEEEAEEAARKAGSAQGSVGGLPSSTSGMTDKEKEKHEKDSKHKKDALEAAQGELSAIRGRARSLNAEYTQAADDSARLIRGAADDAPPEPGWFDDLLDGVGDFFKEVWETLSDPNFWKMIGDVLADLAMIVGFAALFISGIGMLAFALAIGALAFHLLAKAGGADVSWETIAWDAGGALAGGIGLLGSNLARSGRALAAAGRELRLTSGLMATLRSGSGLGALTKIPSGLANSARGFSMAGKGWTFVAAGTAIDKAFGIGGGALAVGSNTHNGTWDKGRWTDGKTEIGDIPVVGPFVNYFNPPDEGQTMAPGPTGPTFDPPATLASSGATFTKHLDPSQLGTAA